MVCRPVDPPRSACCQTIADVESAGAVATGGTRVAGAAGGDAGVTGVADEAGGAAEAELIRKKERETQPATKPAPRREPVPSRRRARSR